MEDVYIIAQSGSLTICDPSIAEHTIRQLRSGGRKVKVFRDRASFLNYEKQQDVEYKEQKRVMLEEGWQTVHDNHRKYQKRAPRTIR